MAPLAPLVDVKTTARDLMHVLTQTLGMSGSVGPIIDLERFQLADGDRILVCTNGVTDALDESIVADVLAVRCTAGRSGQATRGSGNGSGRR